MCSDISARGLDAPAAQWHGCMQSALWMQAAAPRAGSSRRKHAHHKGISLAANSLPRALWRPRPFRRRRRRPEQFFKGKTITFYVGLSPGGGYDQNARLVAKYFGKYVPGNPTVW